MTLLNWIPINEPDQSTKDRMVLIKDEPGRKVYEVDGKQLMSINGQWYVYEEPASPQD